MVVSDIVLHSGCPYKHQGEIEAVRQREREGDWAQARERTAGNAMKKILYFLGEDPLPDLCPCHFPNQTFILDSDKVHYRPLALFTITYRMSIFFLVLFPREIAIINNFVNSQLWKTLENSEATVVQADPCISRSVCSLDFLLLRLVSPWRLSGPIQPSADGL